MKKLSIIIPYHNEDESKFIPLLCCLDSQYGVEWEKIEIIVTNDHVQPKDLTNFFKMFPRVNYVLRYLFCPIHIGPGQNRQYAVDNSNGEYIVFMDSDDELLSGLVLMTLLKLTELNKDMYASPFQVEVKDSASGEIEQQMHTYNNGFLHGKMFKKEYLSANNIRFDNELKFYEDSYYIQIVKYSCPDVYIHDESWYWYRLNESSMTNAKSEVVDTTYKDWVILPMKIISYCVENAVQERKLINFYLWLLENRYQLKESVYSWVPTNILEDSIGYVIEKFDSGLTIINTFINGQNKKEYLEWLKKCYHNVNIESFESIYGKQLNKVVRRK